VLFWLGSETKVKTIEISRPGGGKQVVQNPKVDQYLKVEEELKNAN